MSLPRLLLERLDRDGPREVVFRKEGGRWVGETAARGAARIRALALALFERGIRRGDRVAILGDCRPEWILCDLAVLSLGAITVGLYTSMTAEQMGYVLAHSGARMVFFDLPERRAKIDAAQPRCPALECAISFADLDGLCARGEAARASDPGAFDRLLGAVELEDVATIIYTSGTTGPPKGAVLTHRNLCAVIEATKDLFALGPDDMGVAFLPMAHSLQRVATYGGMALGVRGSFAESIEKLPENWREVRPTVQASVPRIWEKAYARAQTMAAANPVRERLFGWALEVGRRMAEYRKRGAERFAPLPLRLQWRLADRLVYARVRGVFGGRVRFLTSGGAPISTEILDFFYAMGILILEGWGLTETAAPATLNTPAAFRFGTVGRAIPGLELRIAEDGEVLVRGPNVFRGYWRDEAATLEAFAPQGFFRTGDIGEIDADGFLKITDRKKNLIITSSGKKIAPANVEAAIRRHTALASQVYVHGDRRSYLTALVTLDPDEQKRTPEPLAALARAIEAANRELAGYEQVKRWKVIDGEFTQEEGLLTPTLKQKRKAIEERYRAEIEALYAEIGVAAATVGAGA